MRIFFTKMHAAGNDFLILNCLKAEILDAPTLARTLCKRHFSVGADGLVLVLPSKIADFQMKIFNADGSEAQMCGNAARCVGKWLYERGHIKKTRVTLETISGKRTLFLTVRDHTVCSVAIEMGEIRTGEMFFFEAAGEKFEMREVNVGNDHQVAFVPDVDYVDFERIDTAFQKNPRFEDGINTEFCEILDENYIKMRVFERGCGETLACGTGACAAAVAGILNGFCDGSRPIKIEMRGGEVRVVCYGEQGAMLIGDANFVFDGYADLVFDKNSNA